MQQYKTTFYWGDRMGADAHAEICAHLTGGATLADTVGWWRDDDGTMVWEDGATVTVLHEGGKVSQIINQHARTIARRRGESAVLRETVEVATEMLEA